MGLDISLFRQVHRLTVKFLFEVQQLFAKISGCPQAGQRGRKLVANRLMKSEQTILVPLNVPPRAGLLEQDPDRSMQIWIG